MAADTSIKVLSSAFDSPTFGQDASFYPDKPVGSASISPCGRDIVLASRQGLHIIDLDSPYSVPRHLPHHTPWEVADVQWSPFSSRDAWVVSTSNQRALLWNLEIKDSRCSIEHVLHGHTRAITDINFSALHPDILATCAVDSFVHCWDIRHPRKPALSFCDWFAGATQVKWNRQDSHILASSHYKTLHIWDDRKGAYPLRSIKAHATKIYGVDWDRSHPSKLVTCSLDKTIKFWDYANVSAEANHTIHAGFPVWRARHTPFGTGLLAMPQRESNDLHLYDRRALSNTGSQVLPAVHRFQGHENQVKEFLWRPRGTVTEDTDNREFQLVSWGSDKYLRLHRLEDDVLGMVGYERGQQPRGLLNFTRKDAVYKTFREDFHNQTTGTHRNGPSPETQQSTGMRIGRLGQGMSRRSIAGLNTCSMQGHSMAVNKAKASQDMDPISWMKGVKIGKRGSASGVMRQGLSSLLSPEPKADRAWEKFESLGEELSYIGDKFSKVVFEEIDMLNRRVLIAFSGPWGSEKNSIWVKCRIQFPNGYPDTSVPNLTFEASPKLGDELASILTDEINQISIACCQHQLSSLEAIVRYLLGERTLEENLFRIKAKLSDDLDAAQSQAQSSSDEDDDDLQAQAMDMSQGALADFNTQYNVPLPKACGALWANDGRLVCFFPHKEEKVQPLFDAYSWKASERSTRSRKAFFEGFGHLNKRPEHSSLRRSMVAPTDSDSDGSEYSYSSSESTSSSQDTNTAYQLFLPSMGLREVNLETYTGIATGESQWSSGDPEQGKNVSSSLNYVSLHDCQDFLPSRKDLARKYIRSRDQHYSCIQNARVAREADLHDIADIWNLVGLLVRRQVPMEIAMDSRQAGSIVATARRAMHPLRSKDSAIDLSSDTKDDAADAPRFESTGWGQHPFGQQWLVEELMAYFEDLADTQMLAMLSCVLSEPRDTIAEGSLPPADRAHDMLPPSHSTEIHPPSAGLTVGEIMVLAVPPNTLQKGRKVKRSDTSMGSDVLSTTERLSRASTTTTPSISFRQRRTNSDLYEPQTMPLSTSPEQLRRVPRSNSNLASAFAASISQTFFSASASASSSPPTQPPQRKRPSPAGSYVGNPLAAVGFGGGGTLGKAVPIMGFPRAHLESDTEEQTSLPRRPIFETRLKNQDCFDLDGFADLPLLAVSDDWKYNAYREAYSGMLFAWELPMQMCEVLKYNSDRLPDGSKSSHRTSDLSFRKSVSDDIPTFDGINFKDFCPRCTTSMTTEQPTRSCPKCLGQASPLLCLLCTTIIRGLATPCLACGHALHPACRAFLQSEKLPLDDASSDHEQLDQCISGCGCQCDSHAFVEISVPEAAPRKVSEDAETITVHGQETHGRRDETRQDVAYESLARNLGGRRVLTPRTSQIWRGADPESIKDRKKSVGSRLSFEERFGL